MRSQHPETCESGRWDNDRSVQGLSPYLTVWSKLPDRNGAKHEDLYQHLLECSMYANYLIDLISDGKGPSEQLQQHKQGIRNLAKRIRQEGQVIAIRYQAEIHKTMDLCGRIPTSTGWEKAYGNFLWLTSRTLGTPYALLLGCAVKQRQFRLRLADQARLFSFLVIEQQSLICDVLAEMDSRKGMYSFSKPSTYLALTDAVRHGLVTPLEVVPAKRNQEGERILSARGVNQRNMNPGRRDLLDAPESHRYEDWAPVDIAWRQLPCPARRFLKFLSSLRVEGIPEVLLLRLMTATETWGPSGEIENVGTPPIDSIVGDLIQGTAFDFIQLYIRMDLVRETRRDFGRRVFTISPRIQPILVEAEPLIPDVEWLRLNLVCHAFPGRWEEQW